MASRVLVEPPLREQEAERHRYRPRVAGRRPASSRSAVTGAERHEPHTQVDLTEIVEGGTIAPVQARERVNRRLLAGADAFASLATVGLAAMASGLALRPAIIAIPVLAVLICKVQGLYDRDGMVIRKTTLSEWRSIVQAGALIAIGAYIGWRQFTTAGQEGGMRVFALLVVNFAVLATVARVGARRLARSISAPERCLIIGAREHRAGLAEAIASVDNVDLVGTILDAELGRSPRDFRDLIIGLQIDRVVIAPGPNSSEGDTLELVRVAKAGGVRVSLFPGVLAAVGGCARFDDLDGLTLLGVPPFGLSRSSRIIKRTFDLIGASIGIAITSPVLIVMVCAIRLDSSGPALFKQRRVGRNGKPFEIIKFRSMVSNAESLKAELVELNEAAGGLFKITDDPRVTRVGRWLRKTHLDELPQLWNVVRGEMSLVGPRPLIEEEDAKHTGHDRQRLTLTPGMTGPWQIKGPIACPLSEMAKLDYLYVSSWSMWKDLDILLKTASVVFGRAGF